MAELKLALCAGRHSIPDAVDGEIFSNEISDVTATENLENRAFSGIWNACFNHYKAGESGFLKVDDEWDGFDMEPLMICRGLHIDLYVTGLTVALIAAINCCAIEGIDLTLWHFNRDTGGYYPQEVTIVKSK